MGGEGLQFDDENLLQFDAAKDRAEPLTIAASIEKGGSADQRVQMNSARMVVVANSTFMQDDALTQDQQGLDFVSASLNWLLSREQLIGIAPKVPQISPSLSTRMRCAICAGSFSCFCRSCPR